MVVVIYKIVAVMLIALGIMSLRTYVLSTPLLVMGITLMERSHRSTRETDSRL